ncbi:transglycosylase domain-containing protein [Streptomyces sp. TRM 70361]|uniref:transglycosylase domain-containing protein n=1 Tax=Streptomyces sp. TRM 70361 TaxID=3116553 RepID=UPI002E7B202F|nr:transglycosylase domain-containing protein [Streptomyces sp. TRM 70361]MEE1939536.1 transglycosylase domain-containing protein [Streptomyces sp. TRM 70361]
MSEHRRKPSQSRGRRAAQPPSGGRRAASPHGGAAPSSHGMPSDRPQGGRAEARRTAQRAAGGRRRTAHGSTAADTGRGRARSAPPGRKRVIDYPRAGKHGWRRWTPSWKLVSGLSVAFLGMLVGLVGLALYMVEVPSEANAAALQQNNVYYWSDGTVMARVGDTNRQNVEIADIPQSMQNAVIAAENATFWEDPGFDVVGIGRAVVNMATGGSTQSGSTITQQFVKNTYLSQDQTITRKAKELFISIKVNTDMEKEDILQGYLNTSYYGRNAYGIQAAAQAYFEKDAAELDPAESALLATVLKGADLYDPAGGVGPNSSPKENRERAMERWEWILDRQVEVGLMSQTERDKYTEFPEPAPRKAQAGLTGQTGYLVDIAAAEVKKTLGIDKPTFDKGGYQIHTTFDKKKTAAMVKSVSVVEKEYIDAEKRPDTDKFVQFGAASVEPGTGKIVALYGGPGFDKGHFTNNANTLGVPVGSVWKPFVLAAAMEHGTYKSEGVGVSPSSEYNGDNKLKIKKQDGTDYLDKEGNPFYQVNNADKDHGYITLRRAMEVSANTPFVQLGMDVGMDKVKATAAAAGIEEDSFDPNLNPSFALGTSTPGAIEMANSYATFSASGTKVDTYSVTKVEHNGEEQPGFEKPAKETSIDANIANNITDVLRGVIEKGHGTGEDAKALGRPAAGKTGTTDENKSAWWVGYTPQLSTAVTMFRTDPDQGTLLSMKGVGGFESIHGGELPTEVWTAYMKDALKGEPKENFPKAKPIGKKIDQSGAPSSTPSQSEEPESTPSETESEEEKEEEPSRQPETSRPPTTTPPTGPENTCRPGDWLCEDNGGTEGGSEGSGETEGGSEGTGETEGGTEGTGDTNGNANSGNGGFPGGNWGGDDGG